MLRTLRRRVTAVALGIATALGGGWLAAGVTSPAHAAVPATIPLTITNNSGRAEQVHIYNLGTELSSGRQGWADASGAFHPWPAGGNPPTPAPDASI
ncbi:sugar hydrolase, partial [Streptomyces tunisiensis]